MVFGVLGHLGVHAMYTRERRREQENATTQHLKTEVPHVKALQLIKLTAKVHILLKILINCNLVDKINPVCSVFTVETHFHLIIIV